MRGAAHDQRRDCRHLGDARQRADAVRIEIGRGEDAPHPGIARAEAASMPSIAACP